MSPTDLNALFKAVYKPIEECSPREAFAQGEGYGRSVLKASVLHLLRSYLPEVKRDIYQLPNATTLLLQQIHDDIAADNFPPSLDGTHDNESR